MRIFGDRDRFPRDGEIPIPRQLRTGGTFIIIMIFITFSVQPYQGDLKKDEKRLEVKIPADSDGLNESIRLAISVSLELELELSRTIDYETMLLHLRIVSK